MNTVLLTAIQQLTTQYGESILTDSKRVNALLSDLAAREPKPQRMAFVKCLMYGYHTELKTTPPNDRPRAKKRLAQKLRDEEGMDAALAGDTLDLLEAALFGSIPGTPPEKIPAAPPQTNPPPAPRPHPHPPKPKRTHDNGDSSPWNRPVLIYCITLLVSSVISWLLALMVAPLVFSTVYEEEGILETVLNGIHYAAPYMVFLGGIIACFLYNLLLSEGTGIKNYIVSILSSLGGVIIMGIVVVLLIAAVYLIIIIAVLVGGILVFINGWKTNKKKL
jgi:hypothetical protein